MKKTLLSLALATAVLFSPLSLMAASAAAPAATNSPAAPDPASEIKNLAQAFRAGDLAGLAQGLVPPSKWEAARLAFEIQRKKPTSASDRAEFAEKIQQFTAPDAVDQLMQRIEPELVKARPQMPAMTLMALTAVQFAVKSPDSKLTEAQRRALESALPGVQRWVGSTDFLSSDSLRHALTLLTEAARRTGITDIDQLKSLPLEGVLDRAAPMLAAAKEAVRGYGVDLDAVADSLKVEVLDLGRDTARVRTTVTLFGAPVWSEHDLVLVEGHWYGKHAALNFDELDELEG